MKQTQKGAKPSASREKLVDAAEFLMSRHGYLGTSISMVCKELKIPPTSIYWHFKSKEDLLVAVIKQGAERFLSRMDELERQYMKEKSSNHKKIIKIAAKLLDSDYDFFRFMMLIMLDRRNFPEQGINTITNLRKRSLNWWKGLLMVVFSPLGEEKAKKLTDEYAAFCRHTVNGAVIAQEFDENVSITKTFSQVFRLMEVLRDQLMAEQESG